MEDEKWICSACKRENRIAASWCYWCGYYDRKKSEKKDDDKAPIWVPPLPYKGIGTKNKKGEG